MTTIRGELKKIHKYLPGVLMGVAFLFQAVPAWSLTLPEAVDLAVKTYPEVLSAAAYEKTLEQKLRKEFAGYLPGIDFSAGYGYENSDNSTTQALGVQNLTLNRGESGLTLNQMIFDGFDVSSKVEKAKAQLQAAQAGLRKAEDDTALKAVQSYVDVVIKHAQLELIKDNVLLHQRILSKVRKKFSGGAGNQADVHQAKSRTYLASAGHASSQAAYQASQARFTEIIGKVPGDDMPRPATPEILLPISLEEAVEVALRSNPELESARLGLAAAEAELDANKASFWPKVNLELGATKNNDVGGSGGQSDNASAMVRMRYNLYQGGADLAEVRGARNQIERMQQILDKVQRSLIEKIQETWSKLNTTRDRVDFLKKHVAVSKQVTSSYHDQFKMGKRTLLDVLNSENELFSATNALLFEELTYIKTSYEMLASMGTLRQAFLPEERLVDGLKEEEPLDSSPIKERTEPTADEQPQADAGPAIRPLSNRPLNAGPSTSAIEQPEDIQSTISQLDSAKIFDAMGKELLHEVLEEFPSEQTEILSKGTPFNHPKIRWTA